MQHHRTTHRTWLATLALVLAPGLALAQDVPAAQDETAGAPATFDEAAADVARRLEASVLELAALRAQLAEEKLPMARRLSELEAELTAARAEYQTTARTLEGRQLDLSKLDGDIAARSKELDYLANLFAEYTRNFESRLHVAELARYAGVVEAASLAPEDANLDEAQKFDAQLALVSSALDRLLEAGAGARFDGSAVGPDGTVHRGTFVALGPAVVFRSAGGELVGSVEQRVGSLEPTVIPFADPAMAALASQTIATGGGQLPLDATLGSAHAVEATQETLVEHLRKGGPVMVPILALAGAALLVVLAKWVQLSLVRRPSRKSLDALFTAVERDDQDAAREAVRHVRGPTGRMLEQGVEHMHEPRALIEEVMYETVLTTRLSLQRFLPFVAISAASAPLLGLLGTVTGIINTFDMLTVHGSGDVKALSGGISEALITTEWGLIVAIPSLLLHAFLARKASGFVSRMESTALRFANEVERAELPPREVEPPRARAGGARKPELANAL